MPPSPGGLAGTWGRGHGGGVWFSMAVLLDSWRFFHGPDGVATRAGKGAGNGPSHGAWTASTNRRTVGGATPRAGGLGGGGRREQLNQTSEQRQTGPSHHAWTRPTGPRTVRRATPRAGGVGGGGSGEQLNRARGAGAARRREKMEDRPGAAGPPREKGRASGTAGAAAPARDQGT